MKILVIAVAAFLALSGAGNAKDKKFNPNDLPPEKQKEFYFIVVSCVAQAANENSTTEAATAAATGCAVRGITKSPILKGVKLPDDFRLHVILDPPPAEDSPDAVPTSNMCPAPETTPT